MSSLFQIRQDHLIINEGVLWKDIPGYEGYYQVSNTGKVRSIDREIFNYRNKNNTCIRKGKLMTPQIDRLGYCSIVLHKYGINKSYKVHQLVMRSFHPCDNTNLEVNHIDGDKKNNHVDNLEWCSHIDNMRHCVKLGLKKYNKGENSPNSKLSDCDIPKIREMASRKISYISIAKLFNVNPSTIRRIIIKETWKHI